MYCVGSNCRKSATCKLHNITLHGSVQATDWSTFGHGRVCNNGCIVTYDCGDDSVDYPKYQPIASACCDKNGLYVAEGDILRFDNGHRFKLVIKDSMYCLESLDIDLPLLRVDKICLQNQFVSATKESDI